MTKSSFIIGALLVVNVALSAVILSKFESTVSTVDSKIIQSSPVSSQPAGDKNPLIAKINGTDVTQVDILPYLNEIVTPAQLDAWGRFENIPPAVLQNAINNIAIDLTIVEAAKKESLDTNAKLQSVINQQSRRLIKNTYLNQLSPTLIDEALIKLKYEELKASLVGKKEYSAKHILLASEKEANIIVKAIKKEKRPFDELAKLFSLDESTGLRGGNLGYQLQGQLNADFENAISKLKINELSKPFETSLGWHVAIVDDRRDSKAMPFEQAEPVIRRKLEQQALTQYLTDLLENIDIQLISTNEKEVQAGENNKETASADPVSQ